MKKLFWTAGLTALIAGFAVPSPAYSGGYCGDHECLMEEDCWVIIKDCDTCTSQSPVLPGTCELT